MPDSKFESLTSVRLRLHRFREADLPFFCRYRADPEVARYQSWLEFTDADGRRFFAEQCKLDQDTPGAWFQLAIELQSTGEMIGDCALHTLATESRQAEIGLRREAYFRQNVWFKGTWGDEYLYAILREEWLRQRESS
jgi:RimJ/RimL family protein N-acetyltransferase